MALTYLIDTSVLTRMGRPLVRERVTESLLTTTPWISRLSALEVGFSARSAEEWWDLQGALDVFSVAEVIDEDHREALTTQRELARRGLRGRKIPNLIIAATARRLKATVLHYDRDFEHIAEITGQSVEWVVRAGSID